MAYTTDVLINDFALRSLRETADKDYVHARLAFRARLVPQFFWSSLHCLEKYAKCVLVLNRVDASKVKHEVTRCLDKLKADGPFAITLSLEAAGFVHSLENGARFRYYEASYDASWADLGLLDRAVWELRRYCQPLNYTKNIDGVVTDMLAVNLMRIRDALVAESRETCISNGWLEQVLGQPAHPSYEGLVWLNQRFGPGTHASPDADVPIELGNSPLFVHPEIVDEVAKYVFLPREVMDAYRQLKAQRAAGQA